MLQISIIVPCVESVPEFETTLASALRDRPEHSQIVAVHPGTYHDPHGLAKEGEIVLVDAKSPRMCDLWTSALASCSGEYVIWLHPGSLLTGDQWHDILAAFADPTVGAVAPRINGAEVTGHRSYFGIGCNSHGASYLMPCHDPSRRGTEFLGPSFLAGAFRHDALGWLDFHQFLAREDFWDAELGCALQILGYRSVVSSGWQIEWRGSFKPFTRFTRPHGETAQRMQYRYGIGSRPLWRHLLGDILASAKAPWRLQHAWQRICALRYAQLDKDIRREVNQLAEARLAILHSQSLPTNTQSTRASSSLIRVA